MCTVRALDGFFGGTTPFWLIGCSHVPASTLGNVELRVLDAAGDPMGAYFIGAASITGSRSHGTLIDLELSGMLASRPHPLAGAIWNRWYTSKPSGTGEWARLPSGEREAWLEVVRSHHRWARRSERPQGTVITLDGTQVREPVDFYCAIGEAVNGPGGYFGANLDGLRDCLRGGFGITAPFELVWQPPPPGRLAPIVAVLTESGVRIR